MGKPISSTTYLGIWVGLLFVASALAILVLVNHTMRRQALVEAQAKARVILDRNLATHTYFTHDLKPKLFELTDGLKSADYFEPTWMSSTYAVRKMSTYFRQLNPKGNYYYKECAINARSPENEADEYESNFLKKLNSNPELVQQARIRVLNGKPFFTVTRRGEAMERSCLRCHTSPEHAPQEMVHLYGSERSFNRKLGDVVSAISLRIPLCEAYSEANRFSLELSGLLVAVLVASCMGPILLRGGCC